jgi:hypothetical protein
VSIGSCPIPAADLVLDLALARVMTEPVPTQEELQKQDEVAPVHDQCTNVVVGGEPARIGRRLFTSPQDVTPNDRDRHPHHHLADLRHGDVHGPEGLRFPPDRHEKVVKVHETVHSVVHGAENQSSGRAGHV